MKSKKNISKKRASPRSHRGAGRRGRPAKVVSLPPREGSLWLKRFVKPPRELFGEVTVRMGFVTGRDVNAALKTQQELRRRGRSKLIGLIMLEMGLLSTTQLIAVLKEMELKEGV